MRKANSISCSRMPFTSIPHTIAATPERAPRAAPVATEDESTNSLRGQAPQVQHLMTGCRRSLDG
jgi:hypothetical protein